MQSGSEDRSAEDGIGTDRPYLHCFLESLCCIFPPGVPAVRGEGGEGDMYDDKVNVRSKHVGTGITNMYRDYPLESQNDDR